MLQLPLHVNGRYEVVCLQGLRCPCSAPASRLLQAHLSLFMTILPYTVFQLD